jgi:hypothetical protein
LQNKFISPLSCRIPAFPLPEKPDYCILLKLKNQVMRKIRLKLGNENVQATLVIAGFVMMFALLVIFFF